MNKLHIRNHAKCPACCCHTNHTHGGCGGKFHEQLVDDSIDEGYLHNHKCDKCNLEWYVESYEDMPILFAGD